MNVSKILISTLVLIGMLGLTVSGSAQGAAYDPDPVIKLQVVSGVLKIHDGPECINSNHKGCVKVPKGETANIHYELIGAPDWSFSRMQLVSGVDADKWDFKKPTKTLTTDERKDFEVSAGDQYEQPNKKDIIDLTGLEDGREFILQDFNKVPQTYRYQIEVCPEGKNSGAPACLMTDPKIDNEGHN
jgi:hypothetical protein